MPTATATILVVEDDRDDQLLIEKAFRKAGVKAPIHKVFNGEEALAYLKGNEPFADRHKFPYPTFIMTDLKMPKMDGFAVLEFLKKNPLLAIIPTVVLSASNDQNDVKKAYLLGASAFHVKPNNQEALVVQLKILYEYWRTCVIPEVDATGKQLQTKDEGKLGERMSNLLSEEGIQSGAKTLS